MQGSVGSENDRSVPVKPIKHCMLDIVAGHTIAECWSI